MAAALWEQQTWVNGVPQVTNWNRYRTTKLSTMPQIDVQILEGSMPAKGGPVSLFIDIVGMPLTPLSYAGVARRTAYRRAVYLR
jgi:hypothetical protein